MKLLTGHGLTLFIRVQFSTFQGSHVTGSLPPTVCLQKPWSLSLMASPHWCFYLNLSDPPGDLEIPQGRDAGFLPLLFSILFQGLVQGLGNSHISNE